ncbi:aspartate kinase [Labilibaculum manganireducens]|uniref:Aspartokinase n=1 Tax=Labilibaculum manganireducens TaxID=1940525 RepID=A0A2N3I9X3_9BACT|nr:aspartate kinase [Labilibaculum manganireducens]PKQ67099.1 aspartate kinase [Labilibaculum manganireducens]
MNIFKFGGASVNSADGVRNFVKIVQSYREEMIIVLSAMGKTTNALEEIVDSFVAKKDGIESKVDALQTYHTKIINELFSKKDDAVFSKIESLFGQLRAYLQKSPSLSYEFDYDQIVCFGELISTTIVSEYLRLSGTPNKWVDIRTCLKTDDTYKEGRIDWELSQKLVPQAFGFTNTFVYVTQGFLGGTKTNQTTTLGREGSDYTAAILSYILDVDKLAIWKDVPGIMNADPKWLPDAQKLERISYQEAIELAFYGAKVIHPKTIQPIKKKKIPLQVRSFLSLNESGTLISTASKKQDQLIPVYIRKQDQVLISIRPSDFSFILEENLSSLFSIFAKHRVKVNLIQNSAISFSVCVDNSDRRLKNLIEEISTKFEVRYNENLELITIRHHNSEAVERMTNGREILLEQRSRDTAQFVLL